MKSWMFIFILKLRWDVCRHELVSGTSCSCTKWHCVTCSNVHATKKEVCSVLGPQPSGGGMNVCRSTITQLQITVWHCWPTFAPNMMFVHNYFKKYVPWPMLLSKQSPGLCFSASVCKWLSMLFVMQHCLCAVLGGKGTHRQCIQLYESCDQINVPCIAVHVYLCYCERFSCTDFC